MLAPDIYNSKNINEQTTMKKQIYSQPTAEIYELKLRGNVLQGVSPQGGIPNITNDNVIIDDDGYNG